MDQEEFFAMKTASSLVRGMGMGMKVLELLIEAAKAKGADEEVFTFLTHPRFAQNLGHIGIVIAQCDWRIPASEMRARARKIYKELDPDATSLEEMANLRWYGPMQKLGIPYQIYDNDPGADCAAITPLLAGLLHGKRMTYPLFVDCGSRHDVVVEWNTINGAVIKPDQIINMSNVDAIGLANRKYFDFDK